MLVGVLICLKNLQQFIKGSLIHGTNDVMCLPCININTLGREPKGKPDGELTLFGSFNQSISSFTCLIMYWRYGGLAAVGGLSAPSHGPVYCSLPLPPRNRELKEALLGHSEALDTSDN